MRRLLLTFCLVLIACRVFFPSPEVTPTGETSPTSGDITHSLTPTIPVESQTPTFTPTPEPSVTPTWEPFRFPIGPTVPAPSILSGASFEVRFHPDGGLFVGDKVSMELIPPERANLAGKSAQVITPDGTLIEALFEPFGISGRQQATFQWFWDTAELNPGDYTLSISIQPGGPKWVENIYLRPADQVPPPQPQARWAYAESECCLVYYITNTLAENDLDQLINLVDAQAADAEMRLEVSLDEAIPVVFIPRVLGHGGFTASEISVSYLERNYAGSSSGIVLHHEIVHYLDGQLGGDYRPSILVEGLAVYLSGGHFKPETLLPRVAALLPPQPGCVKADSLASSSDSMIGEEACGLDWYIPLENLTEKFYFAQHEVGYLEAGALVEFMVNTWGWQSFSEFYRNIPSPAAPVDGQINGIDTVSGVMGAALQAHFGLTLERLEERFLEALQKETLSTDYVQDVHLTVTYYDTVRRYQRILDPSAFFLTAWLLDSQQMREEGVVADYVRHPSMPENQALETMLVDADVALRDMDYVRLAELLLSINLVLDGIERNDHEPFLASPLASEYLEQVLK